ncbi:phosphoribosyltransferase [Solidesulfovibrio fructosivorans JJ]]|uniref:Phosphoribosyltransferase n=1 Tax=Solidesulfovibrio fructosivorans JJ] TaxID=596151 RepID=E1K091_SOLFR|nr:ComF family protein [Solidesulfovibrio fructosivorans]EFL50009.1 phosphoribosyltransferase [Solidesulfovibrio fructosivorans JJ]]
MGLFRAGLPRLAGWLARAMLFACDRCQACSGLLPVRDGPHPVCPLCAARLTPRLGGYCPRCGELAADPAAPPQLCPECLRQGRSWDGFAFHGPYEGLLRDMVLGFKFHGRLGQGRVLAELTADAYARAAARTGPGAMDPAGPDVIVPVPLYPRRLAWRGFNQSLELARELSRRLARPVAVNALARIRDTTPQSQLPGSKRLRNIQGAFAAAPEIVSGRAALLVDDVMTTGATVETAARALRLAGAERVDVVVVAR